ncbi:MAG: hypothetical protein EXS36_00650 [Pedosphaera sp.]|nr:hypothetical protein [Pedosphaera sp.]
MNARILSVVAILTAVGLAVALIVSSRSATADHRQSAATINTYSNQVLELTERLSELRKVNLVLEGNLTQRGAEVELYSNKLSMTETRLVQKEAEAVTAAAEIQKRDHHIAGLEGQREDLTKKMGDLNTSITNLETRIGETQRKLTASEGDRATLLKELRRLQTEKADLEKKFKDLVVLRDQVKKLREELSIARRLDFIRRGITGTDLKGGALLQQGIRRPGSTNAASGAAPLKVELDTQGRARVIEPAPPSK